MKVHIYRDERYPDYGISKPSSCSPAIEISEELYAEIVAVESAYDAMQDTLEALSGRQRWPVPERITQAEIDAIKATTTAESNESIQAAIDAVKARGERAA